MASGKPEIVSPPQTPRLPPGQVETQGWPVLHYGGVPGIETSKWTFRVQGLVEHPVEWSWPEMKQLSRITVRCDIHCVTRWSKFDNVFEGVPMADVLSRVLPRTEAKFVIVHAEGGFTTNLPLEDLMREDVVLAMKHNGEVLTPDHGWPMRLVVPHLYLWKSAKWIRGLEFTDRDRPGFWERNGYHMRGNPWSEERYSF